MKCQFSVVWALAVIALIAPVTSSEGRDPFFVPRPDFYRERGIAPPPAFEKQASEPTAPPNLARQVLVDFKTVFTRRENLAIVAIGGGAAAAASYLDDTIAESGLNEDVNGGGALDATFEVGKVLGSTPVQLGAALATYAVGKLGAKPGAESIGRDLVRAQIVTSTLTLALKHATGRERPDGSNKLSFPSGHASGTFATATVLQRHYGWDIGIPAFIVAGYVATSRLNEAKHYLSDVVFGATLGILVGRTVTVEIASKRLALGPMIVPAGVGLQLTWIGSGGD